ncbi:hypothetical protein [Streptomyces sp. CAU 1734]|uniref:hypothetical protein n=1 Tax=Streptomyces sp. CAU 1734 TaxID=3140360 RepID=UPI0032603DA4
MKALLRQLGIPFSGSGQALRLLLTGSRLIVSVLLRRLARVVTLGWRAAMGLGAPPPAQEKGTGPADAGSAAGEGVPGTAAGRRVAAGDAVERVGLGCMIVTVALVVLAGLLWLFWWLAWPRIAPIAPVGGIVLAAVWIAVAWMVAPPVPEAATQNDHEMSAGEQGPESAEQRFARQLVLFVVAAVRDAEPDYKGVHIAELLERLQAEAHGFGPWDQTRLREWCIAAGIPVSRTLRAKGKGPTWGVRAGELREAFGTSLDEALEALAEPLGPAPAGPPVPGPGGAVPSSDNTLSPAPPAQALVEGAGDAPARAPLHTVTASSPETAA